MALIDRRSSKWAITVINLIFSHAKWGARSVTRGSNHDPVFPSYDEHHPDKQYYCEGFFNNGVCYLYMLHQQYGCSSWHLWHPKFSNQFVCVVFCSECQHRHLFSRRRSYQRSITIEKKRKYENFGWGDGRLNKSRKKSLMF